VLTPVETIEPEPVLVARARRTVHRLGLGVAGVDYIVNDGGATLLEVNAYPGFDDADGAPEAFVSLAAAWWRRLSSSS
jgi:glutathione synthase/RimK-type ligase-like ATP-grasp enzyme